MKILLDLNIFNNNISREDDRNPYIQEVFQNLKILKYELFITSLQIDKLNEIRIKYNIAPGEIIFKECDYIYSYFRKKKTERKIDLLVTNQIEIIKHAYHHKYDEFVLTFEQFRQFLKKELRNDSKLPLHGTMLLSVSQIGLGDDIWKPLYANYPFFDKWLLNIQKENRQAWVYSEEDEKNASPKIQAICIFKKENNPIIDNSKKILKGKVLKLCTFDILEEIRGKRIGERLLFAAITYAINEHCKYIYLHSNNKAILHFCEKFGFKYKGKYDIVGRNNPDLVYVKPMILGNELYSPYFFKGNRCGKYIVRLTCKEQYRLFPNFSQKDSHPLLPLLCSDDMQSNNINKSYICRAVRFNIPLNSLILFYCKLKHKEYIVVCSIDKTSRIKKNDITAAQALLSKRSEYNASDLNELISEKKKRGNLMIILFKLLKYKEIPSDMKCKLKEFKISYNLSLTHPKLNDLLWL